MVTFPQEGFNIFMKYSQQMRSVHTPYTLARDARSFYGKKNRPHLRGVWFLKKKYIYIIEKNFHDAGTFWICLRISVAAVELGRAS